MVKAEVQALFEAGLLKQEETGHYAAVQDPIEQQQIKEMVALSSKAKSEAGSVKEARRHA